MVTKAVDSQNSNVNATQLNMSVVFFILLFLVLSALFSGTEIAFISASKLQVELKKNKGGRRGKLLAKFYDAPADFLSTMLVGNNIALVVFSILATQLLELIWPISNSFLQLFTYTVVTTIVVLIFGEFLPKTLFRLYANQVLYSLAYLLTGLRIILWIPAWIMVQLSNLLIRIFVKNPIEEVAKVFTRLDLETFVKNTATSIDEEIDKDLFEKALYLRDVSVKETMIPRTEITYIDVTADIEALKTLILETQLSRIIVVKENDINEVLGYVHHQQLLESPTTIAPLVMDVPIVPETMAAQEVMNIFIKERTNIACVVDEFGSTSGILTLEDILEELFGEIEDEHDDYGSHTEEQVSETEFLFSGRLEIDYLNERYPQLNFPDGDYHTLSGYIVMTREEIPEDKEEFELDNYRFVLELVSNTKIETVRVFVLEKEE